MSESHHRGVPLLARLRRPSEPPADDVGERDTPDTHGADEGISPDASQWLPPEVRRGENRRATGEWLPANEPQRPTAQPAPQTSWLPPGLTAPEPATATQLPTAKPAGARAAASLTAQGEGGDHGRRARAVNAYARELFRDDVAAEVAREILGSLRGGITEDAVLLELTRTAAADVLVDRPAAARRRTRALSVECGATPRKLAGRANGTMRKRERDELERHLSSCLVCRAAELRATRADRALAAILGLQPTITPTKD